MHIFLHRNASCSPGNRRLFLQFFFGSLNLATSDPVKLQLGPNNKAETQHATRILQSTITCDQTSGVLHRPIAKVIREPTGRKAELSSKAYHLQAASYPGIQSLEATTRLHLDNEAAATSKEDLTHFIFQTLLFRSEIQAGATKDGIVHENTTLRRSSYRRPAQHLRRRQVCDLNLNLIPKLPTNTRNLAQSAKSLIIKKSISTKTASHPSSSISQSGSASQVPVPPSMARL